MAGVGGVGESAAVTGFGGVGRRLGLRRMAAPEKLRLRKAAASVEYRASAGVRRQASDRRRRRSRADVGALWSLGTSRRRHQSRIGRVVD